MFIREEIFLISDIFSTVVMKDESMSELINECYMLLVGIIYIMIVKA